MKHEQSIVIPQTDDNKQQETAADHKRMVWASRRGMLELDLLMQPFAKQCFPTLNPAEQRCFVSLLQQEDNDLFSWLLKKETPDDPKLATMINRIIAYTDDPQH